jgi:hypothetical protein
VWKRNEIIYGPCGIAAIWLREDEIDKELEELINQFIDDKHFSQQARHQAFKVLKRWQKHPVGHSMPAANSAFKQLGLDVGAMGCRSFVSSGRARQ